MSRDEILMVSISPSDFLPWLRPTSMETRIGSGRHCEMVRRGEKQAERIWSIARPERSRGGSQADVVGDGAGSVVSEGNAFSCSGGKSASTCRCQEKSQGMYHQCPLRMPC